MSSIKLSRWLLLGGVCYILFALVRLPATVVVNGLAPEGTTISGISGTAWSGSAATVNTGAATLSDVRWSLKPWKLILLKASADVNAKVPGGAIRTEVNASLFSNSGTAKNLRGVVKLEHYNQMLQLPVPISGTAGLRFDALNWANNALVSSTGEIQLAEIRELSSNTELGSFSIDFSPDENDSTRGLISDTEAVFKLTGNLMLNADRSFSADIAIEPTNSTPQTVITALSMLGANRDAAGNFMLTSQGTY